MKANVICEIENCEHSKYCTHANVHEHDDDCERKACPFAEETGGFCECVEVSEVM